MRARKGPHLRRSISLPMRNHSESVIWLTGISGSGKSTISSATVSYLREAGHSVFSIDGDVLRQGLSNDLSFSAEDRLENMRRAAEVAYLTSSQGLVTVVSMISPSAEARALVRRLVRHGKFVQVFVDTPLALAEARDVKGLYKQARAGQISNFTGIGATYERPTDSEIVIDTSQVSALEAAERIVCYVREQYGVGCTTPALLD